jgi:predicted lipase
LVGLFRSIFILLTGISVVNILGAQDLKLSASVDRNPVTEDDQFVYQIEVSGNTQNLPDITLPDFSQFRVVGGPSSSSSIQIINFKISASRTYTVVLMPRNKGTFEITPATVTYKGKQYASESLSITVQSGTGQKPSAQQSTQTEQPDIDVSQLVFIRAIPSKRTTFINEEVNIRYMIYFRTNISGNEVTALPEAVGCWVEEYPIPQRPPISTEKINGVSYNVAEIKKVAVFPSKSGKITISPLEMVVDLVVPRKKRKTPRSLFDDFFSDPFSQVVKKRISSNFIDLSVQPLPETGKPNNFSGLVGNFSLHSSLDKDSVAANEAIALKVEIAGTGLLKFLNDLDIYFSPDFQIFDPKISESLNKKNSKIRSRKEFEYIIIPRIAGDQKLEKTQISYFEPGSKSYKYMTIPEYQIRVLKGKDLAYGTSSGTVLSKEEIQLLGTDIRYIKEKISDLRAVGYLPYKTWEFYISLILPVILLGFAFIYRTHVEKMSTNIEYARNRKAQKIAQSRLKKAQNYLKQNSVAAFYGAISNGLLGYIGDKSNTSAAGMVRTDLDRILSDVKIDENLVSEFYSCLDEADYSRFAPGEVSVEKMKKFYKKAEQILISLEKYF